LFLSSICTHKRFGDFEGNCFREADDRQQLFDEQLVQQVLQGYLNGIDDASFAETVKKELHLLPEAMKAMLMLNAR
jgi:hypothetical protein